MAQDLSTQIKIGADASGVEAGVGKAKKSLASLGASATQAGKDAEKGLSSIGQGGDKAAQGVERATKNMQGQLQRLIASFEGGERGSRKFYESLASQRGVDVNALKPLLDQLDAVKAKSQQAAKATKDVGSSFAGLKSAAGLAASAFAAIGISSSIGSFIKLADASTNVASRLGLVTSSATELIAVQQKLFAIAQSSRVSFVDLAGTYAQMARSTKELGISQDAMLGVTKTISQALTISGASAGSAQAALVQLSQGFASGTLRGEELNSVMEQTPRLAQAIADGLGVSIGTLREMGKAGELTAETVVSALQKAAGGVSDEFGKMAVTVEQATTRATNSLTRMVGAIDNVTGATKTMAAGISRVATVMDLLSETFDKLSSQAPLRETAAEVVRLDRAAANLRAGMANGVFGPNAQAELERINARLAEAKQRFRDLDRQFGGASQKDPRDQSGFKGRGESYAAEAKRQKELDESLNSYRLKRDGVPESYVKGMQEVIRLNKEGKLVGDEYTRALKEQQDVLLKKDKIVRGGGGGGAAKAEISAYASLVAGIYQKIEAEKLELEGGARLTASQRERLKIDSDIATGKLKISAAQKASLSAGLDELAMVEQQKEAAKEALKIAQATQAARAKEADGIRAFFEAQEAAAAQALKSATDRITSLQDEEEAAALAAATNISLAQAIERTALARLREKQSGFREDSDGYKALEKEIAARERIIELIGAKELRETADATNKALVQQWDETVKQYDDIFRTGFADMLNNGRDGWKSFTKSLTTTFKTAVADQIYKMFAQPFVMKIVASLLGITGAGGAMAGGAGGAAQNIGNLGSLVGAGAQAIWGGSVGASAASLAGANVVGAVGGDALGALIAGNGAWAGVAVEAGAAAASAGTAAASAASAASSLGSMAAAAGPWIAAAVAIYSIIKSFDDSGTYHMGAGATYSADKGLRGGADMYNRETYGMGVKSEYNAAAQANVDSIAQALGMALDSVAVGFGQKAGYEIATAFADDSSKDGAWGSLRISKDGTDLLNWEDTRKSKWAPKEFGDGEAGYKEYLAAVAKDTRQVLLDMDLPSWADTMLGSIGESASMESLAGVITQIGQIQTAFTQLGKTIDGFAGMADKTFESLMKASGGFANLQQNLGTYYENFYSEAERMGKATEQLAAELAKSGEAMPASKAAYRDLVEKQLAAGEGGAELAAKLLQLSGAFAEVTDFAEQAAEELAKAAEAAARDMRDSLFRSLQAAISLEREQLQIQRTLAGESVSMIANVFRLVRDNAKSLYGEVQQTAAMQAAQGSAFIAQALAQARSSGALPDSDALGTAIGAARGGLQSERFASQADLEFQKLVLAGQLAELGEVSEGQLSIAERTLKSADLQVKRLDETLDYWRKQIDLATGNVDATLSVADAIAALQKAMFPEKPAAGKSASSPFAIGGGTGSSAGTATNAMKESAKAWEDGQIRSLVGGIYSGSTNFSDPAALAQISSLANLQHWTGAQMDAALGLPEGTVKDMMLGAGFDWWKGPKYAVGTNYVPRDQIAMVHEGEAIVPRAYNPAAGGMGGGNSEMVAELRAMRAELAELKSLQAAGNKSAESTHSLLDRVTAGGNAMATEAMN